MALIADHALAWTPTWATPYSSAWSLIQQFCHANLVRGNPLRRRVFHWMDRPPRKPWNFRTYLDLSWMILPKAKDGMPDRSALLRPSPNLHTLPAIVEQWKHSTLAMHGARWLFSLATDKKTRICHECLKIGYQPVFFQLAGLANCPLHDRPLETGCLHCGSELPDYADATTRQYPWRCRTCGYFILPLAELTAWRRDASFRQREARLWAPLLAWLNRLNAFEESDAHDFPRRSDLHEPLSFVDRFHWVLHEAVPLPQEYTWRNRPTTMGVVRSKVGSSDAVRCNHKDDYATFRSIRRYLLRTYFSRRERLCLDRTHLHLNLSGEIDLDEDGCSKTRAFTLWHQAVRSAIEHCKDSVLDGERDAFPFIWAHRILANFYERALGYQVYEDILWRAFGGTNPSAEEQRDVEVRLPLEHSEEGSYRMDLSPARLEPAQVVLVVRRASRGLLPCRDCKMMVRTPVCGTVVLPWRQRRQPRQDD